MLRMSHAEIVYGYRNTSDAPVKIWLSAAPGTEGMTFSHEPDERTVHPFLGEQCYFELDGKEELTYTATYDYQWGKGISDDEREYFLRDCQLIPVNEEIRERVLAMMNGESEPRQQAKRLFDHIVEEYKYSARIKERGFEACTTSKKGDCGELSAVFASYCRSIGIPCRMMVGAFRGRHQLHAWNEVYLEESGWMPVDVSLPMYTFFRNPLANIGSVVKWGALRNRERYFGEVEKGRVVFSMDPESEMHPAYRDEHPASDDMVFPVAGEPFAWGFKSMEGRAPYMQPIYPQLHPAFEKIKAKNVLGHTKVNPSNRLDHYSMRIKIYSFSIGAILVYISLMLNIWNVDTHITFEKWLEGGTSLLFGIFGVLTLARREFNIPILVLSLLFSFSILSFLT
jgi:Transglutaminase-like superfamily